MNDGTFSGFQEAAASTAIYPTPGTGSFMGVAYCALGLTGEAGEVAEQIKKTWRNENCELTPERRAKVLDEIGDVLWYAAQLCTELEAELSVVASGNLRKLQERKKKNELKFHKEAT